MNKDAVSYAVSDAFQGIPGRGWGWMDDWTILRAEAERGGTCWTPEGKQL